MTVVLIRLSQKLGTLSGEAKKAGEESNTGGWLLSSPDEHTLRHGGKLLPVHLLNLFDIPL